MRLGFILRIPELNVLQSAPCGKRKNLLTQTQTFWSAALLRSFPDPL